MNSRACLCVMVKMKFWLGFALFSLVALTVGVVGQEGEEAPARDTTPVVPEEVPSSEPVPGTAAAAADDASAEPVPETVATKDEEEEVQDQVVEEVEKEMEEEVVEHDEIEHEEVKVVDENVQEETVESVAGEPASPSTEAQDSSEGGTSQVCLYFPTIFISALLALKFAH
ncbi:uncharacterized protein [Panulirus ornatus]|uniref:uncharacterized protein isoform X1 n=2 Tax=Panulirus ornatus TaxID=150431 RepID=UPI003A86A3AA